MIRNIAHLNPYELHKHLINEFILKQSGDTKYLKRDTSNDKKDIDVIRENHCFLWDEASSAAANESWEQRLAKKYYDKLFKEYTISDLSRYSENKIALRWRIEQEVVIGKGQFICGNKVCSKKEDLKTWEVNFAYMEHGDKKNALVKLRLCPKCSTKLNYHTKKREIKRLKRVSKSSPKSSTSSIIASPTKTRRTEDEVSSNAETVEDNDVDDPLDIHVPSAEKSLKPPENVWTKERDIEIKNREDEFDSFLDDLLL